MLNNKNIVRIMKKIILARAIQKGRSTSNNVKLFRYKLDVNKSNKNVNISYMCIKFSILNLLHKKIKH